MCGFDRELHERLFELGVRYHGCSDMACISSIEGWANRWTRYVGSLNTGLVQITRTWKWQMQQLVNMPDTSGEAAVVFDIFAL